MYLEQSLPFRLDDDIQGRHEITNITESKNEEHCVDAHQITDLQVDEIDQEGGGGYTQNRDHGSVDLDVGREELADEDGSDDAHAEVEYEEVGHGESVGEVDDVAVEGVLVVEEVEDGEGEGDDGAEETGNGEEDAAADEVDEVGADGVGGDTQDET